MRYISFIFLLIFTTIVHAQSNAILDSMERALPKLPNDSNKVKVLHELCLGYEFSDPATAKKYIEQALDLSLEIEYKAGEGKSYMYVGYLFDDKGDAENAVANYKRAIAVFERLSKLSGVAAGYNNIGIIHTRQGNYEAAKEAYYLSIDNYQAIGKQSGVLKSKGNLAQIFTKQGQYPEAIAIYHEIIEQSDSNDIYANAFNNLGIIYNDQGEHRRAIEALTKAILIFEDINLKSRNLGNALDNIGISYSSLEIWDSALFYFNEALLLSRIMGDSVGVSFRYNNIGYVLDKAKRYDEALVYFKNSLALRVAIGEQSEIAGSHLNIGAIYSVQGKYDEAEQSLNTALRIAKAARYAAYIREAYEELSVLQEKTGRYQLSLESYKKYTSLKDSLFNEDKSKEIGRLEAKHEFEVTEAERARALEVKSKKDEVERTRRDNLQYSGILIFLVLVFAGVFTLGKIAIPIRLAEGLIFFSFLLFFEFMLVMLDPYIEQYSSGAPVLKLGFNALLAGMIFPLHSFFEETLKKRLSR